MTGLLSYGFAALSFTVLTLLLVVSRQRVSQGKLLVLACASTVLWACVGVLASLYTPGLLYASGLTDTLRILTWGLFLHSILVSRDVQVSHLSQLTKSKHASRLVGYPAFMLALLSALIATYLAMATNLLSTMSGQIIVPILWAIASLSALFLLERLYFSASAERRATLKTLCIGLGGMFTLDFFVFTDALLFRRINLDLWQVRGFFYGILTPFIALAIARNPDWSLQLHVSRQAVAGSITLLAAGAYLTVTAVAAYFVRISGMEWASVAQMALILISMLILLTLLVSKKLRATARVLISKHLFSYKYDYRLEWLKFTESLAQDPANAGTSILKGMSDIVDSETGVLWAINRDGNLERIANLGFAGLSVDESPALQLLTQFMKRSGWVIQIDEYLANSEHYDDLILPQEMLDHPDAWLIVPLPTHDELAGIVLIGRSAVVKHINWEDRDLLKTAGRQASTLLMQMRASEALTEARQFEAFSKMSAYIVHDLKNIMSQQSLIVSNAKKHKHKPEFVDDVISTIDNSVKRMQSLLEQLRDQQSQSATNNISLGATLRAAVQQRSRSYPSPQLMVELPTAHVRADEEKLTRVFAHLIHNAQDATPDDGTISVELAINNDRANINISDTGHGMSLAFIKDKLFKPFNSTKGLTGMGIGAYESREYIRSIGGSLRVTSTEGEGSTFEVSLPLTGGALQPPTTPESAPSNPGQNAA